MPPIIIFSDRNNGSHELKHQQQEQKTPKTVRCLTQSLGDLECLLNII